MLFVTTLRTIESGDLSYVYIIRRCSFYRVFTNKFQNSEDILGKKIAGFILSRDNYYRYVS